MRKTEGFITHDNDTDNMTFNKPLLLEPIHHKKYRCLITGRPRGYYRKLKMSRIALREYALSGQIPGMVKSSW